MKPPLIITLLIDQQHSEYFTMLRKKHFPKERNFLDAHVTLFHALPNDKIILNSVRELSLLQRCFEVVVTAPVSIGNGVAFKLESDALSRMHKGMQGKWVKVLSLQDRQKLWPHITIQNKVKLVEAQALLDELKQGFAPFSTTGRGLQVWEYLDGPWRFLDAFPFG
jgi:hypothetical protein